ncbi:MAG: hypothetical protein ACOYL3_07130 [Desulfuromonadaceae bacterium]
MKRQLLYLRALDKWLIEELEWACLRAAETCRFMPVPAELIDLARQAPRQRLRGDLNRPALSGTTSYNETLADEAFKKVMALFSENEAGTIREVFAHERRRDGGREGGIDG